MAKSKLMVVPKLRPGEGREIEVIRRTVAQTDGTTAYEFDIDISHAPVPDRRYLADGAAILFSGDGVRLVLGQQRLLSPKEMRSAVVVFLSAQAVIQFLRSCKDFHPAVSKYSNQHHMVESLADIQAEPEHTTFITSNVILTAFSGREACLDFYNSSPFVLAVAQRGGKFALDPILRVDLGTGLLVAILDRMESLKSDLPTF
ncbi:hypothetical protein [Candidatus Binatus sp.]|uniref:hypothetical protein n=1 Tax=Candidatus Binatus sp. TaxID=2811406 RepID=UPI002F950B46